MEKCNLSNQNVTVNMVQKKHKKNIQLHDRPISSHREGTAIFTTKQEMYERGRTKRHEKQTITDYSR